MVFDPDDHRLLGIHIIGDDAAELIHIGLMVMQLGGTLDTFVQSVFNYPTLGDGCPLGCSGPLFRKLNGFATLPGLFRPGRVVLYARYVESAKKRGIQRSQIPPAKLET